MKVCPHCSTSIHEKASFCPYCAKSINNRTEVKIPRHISGRVIRNTLIAAVVLALALSGWLYTRPKVYDNGTAEVLYTDKDGTYQIVVGWSNDQFHGADQVFQPVEDSDTLHTFPLCMHVNYPSSGVNAKEEFMAKVERVTTRVTQLEDSEYPWETDEPVPRPEYIPEAALVSSIHFKAWSTAAELVWTVEMKNGDIIRLRETLTVEPHPVYRYYPEDTPMETAEELQALADQFLPAPEDNGFAYYEIHLPPITYEGGLVLNGQNVHLYGSTDGAGNRTTFTDTVQVLTQDSDICYIEGVNFAGDGAGIGVSASARLFLIDCQVSGWRTGVLCYGYSWVSLDSCIVEDNSIGLHFNAIGDNITNSRFFDNIFRGNDTAVLLESVPTDTALSFPGTRFERNGADIDNRCGHETDISEAIFE